MTAIRRLAGACGNAVGDHDDHVRGRVSQTAESGDPVPAPSWIRPLEGSFKREPLLRPDPQGGRRGRDRLVPHDR